MSIQKRAVQNYLPNCRLSPRRDATAPSWTFYAYRISAVRSFSLLSVKKSVRRSNFINRFRNLIALLERKSIPIEIHALYFIHCQRACPRIIERAILYTQIALSALLIIRILYMLSIILYDRKSIFRPV